MTTPAVEPDEQKAKINFHDQEAGSPRIDLLLRTVDAVARRGRTYGPPGEHFARTVAAAQALLPDLFAREFTPSDWAKLMLVDKLARDAERPTLDTCIDLAGYAACLAEVRHWRWTKETLAGDQLGGWVEEVES